MAHHPPKRKLALSGSMRNLNLYLPDIRIINPELADQDYCAPNVVVVESQLFLTDGINAAIGRNVLRNCLFTYNGVLQTFGLTYGRQG
jgi:hypothetical protein